MTTRTERDSLGEIDVPADKYWGATTQRALEHFPIGGARDRMPRSMIRALAVVKKACALAHRDASRLSREKAQAIVDAADEVIAGKLDEHFPLVVWQTGSGTQSNMNANEVIANRANELLGAPLGQRHPVHPNDDVNLGQSSNDAFPTAMHIAIVDAHAHALAPAFDALITAIEKKARALDDVVKIGRTHLQDAVPLTFGNELGAWSTQLEDARARISYAIDALHSLALGGTAVGTGLNAPPGFASAAIAHIAALEGRPFGAARDRFAALAAHDDVVAFHAALKTLAVALTKIGNDVRWLSSGPRAGLGEIAIPQGEPGSSIMPGKANPTQAEALLMVCTRVFGNDVAMTAAGASGNFELNVQKPLLVHTALESTSLLADAMSSFAKRCVDGIEVNRARVDELVQRSLMLVTALTPAIGYDKAAEVAKKAAHDGTTLKQAALALGVLDEPTLDRLLDPRTMLPR